MTQAHDIDSYDCWCHPKFIDAETGDEMTREQVEWTWDGVVVVHQYAPDELRDGDRRL